MLARGLTLDQIRRMRDDAPVVQVYKCPICLDRGYLNGWAHPIRPGITTTLEALLAHVPPEEIEFCSCEEGRQEEAVYRKRLGVTAAHHLDKVFAESGIPERLRGLSFDTLRGELKKQKELAILAAKALIDKQQVIPDELSGKHSAYKALLLATPRPAEPRLGLLLYGDNGLGKSALAAIVAEAFIRKGIATLFIDYTEFIKTIQAEYGKEGGDAEAVIKAAIDVPFLALDDLGSAGDSEATGDRREIVYRIVNLRHQKRRWTVITSNLTEAQLESQFSRRTWQRIKELCLVVRVGGLNLRDQAF